MSTEDKGNGEEVIIPADVDPSLVDKAADEYYSKKGDF